MTNRMIVLLLLLLSWASLLNAVETVPRSLAPLLDQAQAALAEERPAAAITTLLAYTGRDHHLRHFLLAQAYAAEEDWTAAAQAYEQTLELRADQRAAEQAVIDRFLSVGEGRALPDSAGLDRAARRGLLQAAATGEDWTRVCALIGGHYEHWADDAEIMRLYIQAALATDDLLLAERLVDTCLIRFPQDPLVRRLALIVFAQRERYHDALPLIEATLAEDPADAALWQRYAHCQQALGQAQAARIGLEAAAALAPTPELTAQRLFAAWQAEQLPHALELARAAMAQSSDHALLCARIAEAAGAIAEGRTWLSRLPTAAHDARSQLLAARLAAQDEDPQPARQALAAALQAGATDAWRLLLWSGQLAEQLDEPAAAEVDYRQALISGAEEAAIVRLYLGRLLLHQERHNEAAEVLNAFLRQQPGHRVAEGLLALCTGTSRN